MGRTGGEGGRACPDSPLSRPGDWHTHPVPTLGRAQGSRTRAEPGVGSWLAALAEAQRTVLLSGHDPVLVARALALAAAGLVDARARVGLGSGPSFRWHASCGELEPTEAGQPARPPQSVLDLPLMHDGIDLGRLELAACHPGWFDPVDQQAATTLAAVAAARLAVPPPDPSLARPPASTPATGIGEVALQAAQELTGLGLWEWRSGSGRLEWSPEMYRLAGTDPAPGAPAPTLDGWLALVHPQDRGRVRDLVDLSDEPGATRLETFRMIGLDGVQRHIQSWATVVRDERASGQRASGQPVSGQRAAGRVIDLAAAHGSPQVTVCGASLDVSGQVNDREMLERLSATDPVTGLGNRLAFDRRIRDLLAVPGTQVAVLLLDLDRFKQVNDTLGHQVGDRLLVEVARRLTKLLPPGCMTARMGGDEFVVLPTAGLGPTQLRRLAQAIVDDLRAPYVLPDSQEMLVCPASVGVTASAGRRVSSDDLLREADLALYRAKDAGRDRFVVFDDVLRARAQSRHLAERGLRSALEQDRLVLQYQPIVDFTDGRVVGAEALVRMRDPSSDRLMGPDAFIAVAEDTGLVVELDCWVIDAAVAQARAWIEQSPQAAPWLAINVSARSMEHPRVARRLIDAVAPGRLPKSQLKVELTEHSFLDTLPGGDSALRQLLSSGIAVGIDDFGTGYSALAYLQRFELDFMKIDRSFVAEVGQRDRADAVVTAIVDLAHAHGMRVTAEGVETPRQARRLREIGCDLAQGYHFGRPGAAARIVRG